jgi:dipeptidyl-peptidase 4
VGRIGLRLVGLGVVAIAAGVLMLSGFVAAQEKAFDMDAFFRRVFLTREIRAKSVGPVRWMDGGKSLAAIEASESVAGAKDVVRYATATNKREVLLAAADLKVAAGAGTAGAGAGGAAAGTAGAGPLEVENCDWSADGNLALIYTNSQRVWRANTRGDYWLFDRRTKKLRKLGGDAAPATLMFATFSPDGTRVAYVHANNIYVESAAGGGATQITKDGSATIINGTSDWVYEEELGLRQAYRWSPDGKSIAYWQFDTAKVKNFPLVYNVGGPYDVVTHIPYPQFGVYPVVKEIPYPQPGTTNSSVRVGVVAVKVGSNKGGTTKWMQVPGDPSDNYIARTEWTADSKALVLQRLNRLQNTNDVLWADAANGQVRQIYREQDAAWVDVFDEMQWVHGGKDFLWESEKDGWRHAYLVSREGKARLLTAGNFDVESILGITPKEDWLYFIASPENATERYLYRVRVDGAEGAEASAKPERLTPAGAQSAGTHAYNISPNFQWAVHTFSTLDSPPRVDLERLPDLHEVRVMEENNEFRTRVKEALPGEQPAEFLRVRVGHDVELDAWMIKPAGFDATKKYPVLVYVYGEPAAQTVMNQWEGERDLFHRALAERGYVVVSFDNRGTPAPRGRDWRKVIYGKVGVLSSEEQTAAIRELAKRFPFVDGERVAVWGWSGGGSNTLNLMFRSPDVYKVGMSVAPVADQRLYDTIYQERYMGLPAQNTDGYKESSAINFAEGLRGNLLIVHSPGDDNVHYQGTELLVNRLVELGKPFDFMEYPGRTHSLAEGAGTHYHLYSLLARYLQEHLESRAH